ncbi:MAG: hypothetical protein RSE91_02460, partial [Bacilli bacterium]
YETSQGDRQNRSWYDDFASFVSYGTSWFHRGGGYAYAANAGVFAFYSDGGFANTGSSFRLVLSPTPGV